MFDFTSFLWHGHAEHNVHEKVVDMRWGVRDEMTNEHMTTELCMRELVSCQKLSIGIVMGKDTTEQILIVLVSSRAQLYLSRWTEVRLPTCSSNRGFCRTQIAEGDPWGNGD